MEILTFKEVESKTKPELYDVTLKIDNDATIKGIRKNINLGTENIIVGRKLNEEKILLIEFNNKEYRQRTLLAQKYEDGYYGDWHETTQNDLERLLSFKEEKIERKHPRIHYTAKLKITNKHIIEENLNNRIKTLSRVLNYEANKIYNKTLIKKKD